jgi:hypothetical protein
MTFSIKFQDCITKKGYKHCIDPITQQIRPHCLMKFHFLHALRECSKPDKPHNNHGDLLIYYFLPSRFM